ncbi:hypothetical protein HW555_009562, partial [Spodoptera exigua]
TVSANPASQGAQPAPSTPHRTAWHDHGDDTPANNAPQKGFNTVAVETRRCRAPSSSVSGGRSAVNSLRKAASSAGSMLWDASTWISSRMLRCKSGGDSHLKV